MYTSRLLILTLVALAIVQVSGALANSIADRIADFQTGEIRLQFAAREGVLGDGDNIICRHGSVTRISSTHYHGSFDDDDTDWLDECEEGPVRVSLRVRDGRVDKIRVRVGGQWGRTRREVLDLGEVAPQDAADYLLDLARNGRQSVAEDAIFPATLARDVTIWQELLDLARDRTVDEDIRGSAIFWLGQEAGDKVTEGLAKLVDDDDEDLEVREAAIFALHEHNEDGSIEALTRVALQNKHPQLRRTALFWLAETEDPQVLDLFERILTED